MLKQLIMQKKIYISYRTCHYLMFLSQGYISNCKKNNKKKTQNNETRNVYCHAHGSCKELVYKQKHQQTHQQKR